MPTTHLTLTGCQKRTRSAKAESVNGSKKNISNKPRPSTSHDSTFVKTDGTIQGRKIQNPNTGCRRTLPKKLAGKTKILSSTEYKSMLKNSEVVTEEEKKAMIESLKNEQDKLMKESIARKETMKEIDSKKRDDDNECNEIENEARQRTKHILERAYNLKLEQEEEIKKCNRIILETKCRAVRDAQIAEKKMIERELGLEEKRLNDMMENERIWGIKEDIRKENQDNMKKREFVKTLEDQINENEERRIIEFEKKLAESRIMNLNNIAWQQEESGKMKSKETEWNKVRQAIAEGNEQLKHFKAMEEEENKIIESRIKEYHNEKEEREKKFLESKMLNQLQRDVKKSKVAAETSKVQDTRAHLDELRASRIQEEVERAWRRREKEEALKRADLRKILNNQREEQINNKRIMQAMEIERDRREFERTVRLQKEAYAREKQELELQQKNSLAHRNEILKQVNEKEKERIKARQKMFEEGTLIRKENEMRKKKLQEAIERKFKEMRENKVPEMYINEVQRMIENNR